MGIILVLGIIAIGIVTIGNCISVALASTNIPPTVPSTGQPSSSLSPPSQPSQPSLHTPNIAGPTEVNPASGGNNTTPGGNNTTPGGNNTNIGPPPAPIIVGPSSFTASPITDENQINVNTTPITPSNGSSLGVPAE
jgi:hypothetical protein